MYTEPSHQHERKTGHNWLDLAIALCALMVSATTLVVAIIHSLTLERMADANARLVETNSWPFIGYGTGHNTQPNESLWLGLVNEGVGPAKLETAELKWNGVPQKNAVEFLKACCGYKPNEKGPSYEVVSGRVLRAGDSLQFIVLPKAAADNDVWARLGRARISRSLVLNVCYCSVFDDCWREDVIRLSLKPEHVEQCIAPPTPFGIPEQE